MEVLFGTPTYDKNVCIDYVTSMMTTTRDLTSRGVAVSAYFLAGNCFIDMARNAIVEHFLKSTQADCLFFVDSDIGWESSGVQLLLDHPAEVVAGLIPKRDDAPSYHQNALTGRIENNWLETVEAPTAFMRIKRSVFEKLDHAYPEYREIQTLNKAVPYFQSGIKDGGFLGEDIFFCRQWVKAGGEIWVYPNLTFTHRGSKVWRGNFYQHGLDTGLFRVAKAV